MSEQENKELLTRQQVQELELELIRVASGLQSFGAIFQALGKCSEKIRADRLYGAGLWFSEMADDIATVAEKLGESGQEPDALSS